MRKCLDAGLDVSIVGLGNWGSSLAHACVEAGVPLREVIVRTKTPRRRSALPLVRFEDAAFDARIIWLCVRDGEIAEVAKQIAGRRRLDGQIVVHSSGALSVKEMAAAKRAGAAVASLPPVMSFPTRTPVSLKGVLFAVEAEPSTRRLLNALVHKLGGEPFPVESSKKPLYHAAATMASPLLVSELSAAMTTARLAGLSAVDARRWVAALARATVENVFSRGEEKSFSGPFMRGDMETISLHLQALSTHPMLEGIYRSLARYATETLPVGRRRELKDLLGKTP